VKYSVSGSVNTADGSPIVDAINNYALWRLVTDQSADGFTFEAWVHVEADKTSLFGELKPFVISAADRIDWHECTHDEAVHAPCVIAETYQRG
jgi:hypothetical protein